MMIYRNDDSYLFMCENIFIINKILVNWDAVFTEIALENTFFHVCDNSKI